MSSAESTAIAAPRATSKQRAKLPIKPMFAGLTTSRKRGSAPNSARRRAAESSLDALSTTTTSSSAPVCAKAERTASQTKRP